MKSEKRTKAKEWFATLSGQKRIEIAEKHFKSYLLPFSENTIVRLYNLEHSP